MSCPHFLIKKIKMLKKTYILLILALSFSVQADMVAHWDFNGTSGITAIDSVGGYNATIYGGAYLNNSGELTLDGVDDYVPIPVGSVISGLSSFTITAKINFSGTGAAGQRIFTFGNDTSVFMDLLFNNTDDNELLFRCRYNSHDEVIYANTTSSLAGEHYFVITLDASTKIARVYIDGRLAAENRCSYFIPSILGTTSNNWIGKSEYTSGAYLKGYIDDFAIYNSVLTPVQISQISGYNGAVEPIPADKAIGAELNLTLGWVASNLGSSFDVYFGNNLQSVSSHDLYSYKGRISQNNFTVSNLKPRTTYYWQVNEVNSQGIIKQGDIWQFKTIPSGTPIKIMSFNIHCDAGLPNFSDPNAWNYAFGTDRKDRVINMIMSASEAFGSCGPDILGVQEAISNQVSNLQSAMSNYGSYSVYGSSGNESCTIFYRSNRFTKLSSGTFWLSNTPDVAGSSYPGAAYPRIASWLILQDNLNNKSYFIMNTHWDCDSEEANYYSALLIRNKIAVLAAGLPVVVMGDLNTDETERAYLRLIGNEDPTGMQFIDTYRCLYPTIKPDEATFDDFKGKTLGSRIDFIVNNSDFHSGRATIERSKVLNGFPSDHYPITATIYLSQPIPADLDKDGKVNLDDLQMFTSDWLKSGYYIDSDQVGLVAHLNFEGAAGSIIATDSAGDHDAAIVGTSLNGNGSVTLAGGTNSQYVDLGSSFGSVVAGLDNSTIFMDFDWDGSSAGTYQKPWTFSQSGTTQFATLTFVSSNETSIQYQHRYSSHDELTTATTPLLRGRHQIAVVLDSTYGSYGSAQIYVDGVQQVFRALQARSELSLMGQTTRNYLGKSPYDTGNYFDGTIYDFRVYNRCLSGQEIADIYNGTVGQTYIDLDSASNFYDDEIINFLDFAIFADSWLESQ
jgi:endonuclease/exonuclease/phosphatase family metal-dependent hydrolase